MPPSFVETLALADDPRLRPFRLATPEREAAITRGDAAAEAPELASDATRAAIDVGAVVSFVAGLEEKDKIDVLSSIQIAQRAAKAKFDRFADTKGWYGAFVEVLEQLGWVIDAFAFTERDKTKGQFSMDKSALDVIAAVATGAQLAILVKTIDTLKKLGDGDRALRIFDLQALSDLNGNFQIGAAEKARNGALALALGAFHFQARDHRGKFLFWTWGADEIRFWTAVTKMTLNEEVYATHRAAVAKRLKGDGKDFVAELELA
jgi:hypothetical protein